MRIITQDDRATELRSIGGYSAEMAAADAGEFYVVAEGNDNDGGLWVVLQCSAFTVDRFCPVHRAALTSFEWRSGAKVADCFTQASAKASATRRNNTAWKRAA